MRININELEEGYTDAGSLILMCEGVPFSGIAYEISPQGTLWCEQIYNDGTLNGLSQDWHLNGQLKSQTEYKWNRVHGRDQGWYENGRPEYDSYYELGIMLREHRWNEAGVLQKSYRVEDNPKRYADLLQEKAIFQKYGLTV